MPIRIQLSILSTVCRRSQSRDCCSCSMVSGGISNCSYRLSLLSLTRSHLWSAQRRAQKSNLAVCLKKQVYNSCVLPAMTYGAETWPLTKKAQNKLAAAQTKMGRNITQDRRINIWVTNGTYIFRNVRKIKISWAGHTNLIIGVRWTSRACHDVETLYVPQENARKTSQAAERRPGQILERHDLAEDRQYKTD